MSIKMVQPSLLLNSYAFTDMFGGCGMFMDTTWNCPKSTRVQDIVNWIVYAYNQSKEKRLHNVILHFHGKPGEVLIGEISAEVFVVGKQYIPAVYNTMNCNNIGVFSALKGKNISTIWLHSCEVAKGFKGKYFCRELARAAGCNVVGAEDEQSRWWAPLNVIFMPHGSIDDFEGPVFLWDRNGNQKPFSPNGGHWQ